MAIRIDICNGCFGQTYSSSDGMEFVERGEDFKLKKVLKDEDTGKVYYSVKCMNLGEPSQFIISKDNAFDKKKLLEFANYGLDVNGSNVSIVPEVFLMKEHEYIDAGKKIYPVHSVAGIKQVKDEKGNKSFIYAGYTNPKNGSEYIGHLNLKPIGSASDWFAFVKAEIKDSIELTFVICLAFAAILHSVLQDETDVDNFVVHIRGDSSSGKTTVLCLAASVFGPGTEKDPEGIISTWNATKNALLRRLMNVNGILMGLDEVSMNREKDFTGLLYSICSGIEKDRLTREAQVQARLVGRYLLLSTGEASLLAKTNGNIGLAMRVLEFDNHQWTKSSEQAERIKRFCKHNSGHAATAFGQELYQYILIKGFEHLVQQFDYWRKYYCHRCDIQARKERMSGRYALILLAAQLANRFFNMQIDIPALCKFIIDNENSNEDDRDNYGDFYNKLIAYIVMNKQHFDDELHNLGVDYRGGVASVEEEMKKYHAVEPWGMFRNLSSGHKLPTGDVSYRTVQITEVAFDKIATKELGYEDPKALRKHLKDKGLLITEGDRNSIRKIFHGTKTKMVEIYMPTDENYSEKELEWMAKEKIKENLNKLSDMASIGFCERTRLFKELEERKQYMTKTQKGQYKLYCKQRKEMRELKLFLDDDDE